MPGQEAQHADPALERPASPIAPRDPHVREIDAIRWEKYYAPLYELKPEHSVIRDALASTPRRSVKTTSTAAASALYYPHRVEEATKR